MPYIERTDEEILAALEQYLKRLKVGNKADTVIAIDSSDPALNDSWTMTRLIKAVREKTAPAFFLVGVVRRSAERRNEDPVALLSR